MRQAGVTAPGVCNHSLGPSVFGWSVAIVVGEVNLVSGCGHRFTYGGANPFVFTNLKTGQGVEEIIAFIEKGLTFRV